MSDVINESFDWLGILPEPWGAVLGVIVAALMGWGIFFSPKLRPIFLVLISLASVYAANVFGYGLQDGSSGNAIIDLSKFGIPMVGVIEIPIIVDSTLWNESTNRIGLLLSAGLAFGTFFLLLYSSVTGLFRRQ